MPFKLSLVADVRQWLRGTKDVEKSLEDVADSLDTLADETGKNAEEAADKLTGKFTGALDKIQSQSKQTGRKLGDNIKKGTKEAETGFDDLKDEANQSAREAAASFSGEFEDVADYVQEVLAQALSGFGPIGAAAGIAAAAGIGILISGLQNAADEAEDAKERIQDLADQIREVGGNPAMLDWLDRVNEKMKEIVDKKEWWEFWQDAPTDRMDEVLRLQKEYNLTQEQMADLAKGFSGDQEAIARSLDVLNSRYEDAVRTNQSWVDANGDLHNSNQKIFDDINRQKDGLAKAGAEMDKAKDRTKGLDAIAGNTEGQEAFKKAQEEAARSNERFNDSLKDAGSVLDDFGDKILKGGKVNFKEWSKLQKAMTKDNKLIARFDAKAELSAEARQNFRDLPREAQKIVAKEWAKGGKSKAKVEQHLEIDAKGKVDTKGIKKPEPVKVPTEVEQPDASAVTPTGEPPKITIPTEVDESGATKGAQSAADHAQSIANRDRNKIEFKTKVKSSGLQSEVNRIARSITPPTVYVNVKAKKEVP